ncbi:MAG: PIN domain-containing protein [Caldilineae bacterium]|nr:PIN domain-containing protein [Anaerolineae bacterium]MCB0200028.1 PIN domain-containing protein [Anaerolineae bacterium]MCB0205123.1 PIN domain-containing protein [Anaerolineae bacterium]MCB0253649.1 PIN domain-containing protein [Anaerolineae bacterium]MCB9153317.1 PIN domain-containing protein [Caldilineae bacterium]
MTAIVDTSFLVSLINPREQSHQACAAVARSASERLILPQVVLPEATYLVDKYLGHTAMRAMVRQLMQAAWHLEPLIGGDIERIAAVLDQYHDQDIDFADAGVVAIAERFNVRRILTLDRRHFTMIRPRHCAAFKILP